jgi:hypothetical protein
MFEQNNISKIEGANFSPVGRTSIACIHKELQKIEIMNFLINFSFENKRYFSILKFSN